MVKQKRQLNIKPLNIEVWLLKYDPLVVRSILEQEVLLVIQIGLNSEEEKSSRKRKEEADRAWSNYSESGNV